MPPKKNNLQQEDFQSAVSKLEEEYHNLIKLISLLEHFNGNLSIENSNPELKIPHFQHWITVYYATLDWYCYVDQGKILRNYFVEWPKSANHNFPPYHGISSENCLIYGLASRSFLDQQLV